MRKYPKYKASGVDWLAEIPSEWNVFRYKNAIRIFQGNAFKSSDYVEHSNVISIRMGNIKKGGFIEIEHNTKYLPDRYAKEYAEYILKENDLIIAMTDLSPSLDFLAVPAIILGLDINSTYLLNQRVGKLTINKNFNIYLIKYLLLSNELRSKLKSIGLGSVQSNMSSEDLYNVYFSAPTLLEQHAIVRFLDYKTGQIDSFIANRQKQIELLKEQKAGIINKAVTKGINPNAKMKDSGIEWIGDVPEHWDFKSLRRITKEHRQGYYIDEPYISEGVKLVRITDLHSDGSINYSEMPFVKITKEHEKLYSIEDGDFLFPRTGTIGSLGFVSNPERAVFASYLIRFRFKSNQVLNDYLYYYFMSDAFLDGVFSDLHGGVVQNIHAENIKNQFIAHPKEMTEQASIVNYIKSEASIIDTLISKYQKQIDLMQEYRTSLISQAVTGKIDVREWQPKKKQTA